MSFNQLETMYNLLNKSENQHLKEYVTNFNDPVGFVWTTDQEVNIIYDAINDPDASPSSFALQLRACQSIFKGQTTLESFANNN